MTTTRNIRTRFRTIEQTGSRPNHPRRLRDRKGIPYRDIPPATTTTNASRMILSHYVLHRTKHRARTPSSSVGLPQNSVDTPERSSRTTKRKRSWTGLYKPPVKPGAYRPHTNKTSFSRTTVRHRTNRRTARTTTHRSSGTKTSQILQEGRSPIRRLLRLVGRTLHPL